MDTTLAKIGVKVADEVWIAAALLHREHPEKPDFTVEEIVDRAKQEGLFKPFRRGFYVHVVQHCVANRPPNPGRYRMLFETAPGRRRLFRSGDSSDPHREGAKTSPTPQDLPENCFRGLRARYAGWGSAAPTRLPAG